MKRGRPQAKDIPDADFLREVIRCGAVGPYKWVVRWHIELPFPWRVQLAKAAALIKRGLLEGCACGCRGDYWVTDAGHVLLEGTKRPKDHDEVSS